MIISREEIPQYWNCRVTVDITIELFVIIVWNQTLNLNASNMMKPNNVVANKTNNMTNHKGKKKIYMNVTQIEQFNNIFSDIVIILSRKRNLQLQKEK